MSFFVVLPQKDDEESGVGFYHLSRLVRGAGMAGIKNG